jgi:alkylation response protein AidB-like acyl-CoA dehydrogenase
MTALAAEAERRFGPFVRERVNPGADARDRLGEPLPREVLAEAGRVGLLGFSLPPEVGGEGRDKFAWGIVVEEVSRLSRDPALSSVIDTNAGVVELLVGTGRPDLVERYAVPMAAGSCYCPPAAYEGRDPFEYATTAREAGGGWRLDGSKPFVGGAVFADAFLVSAREEESGDVLSFLVERGDEGVCVDPLPTPGLRSMGFGTLSLDRVRLPEERLVVAADAIGALNAYLRNRRLMTACAVVGHLRRLFDECVEALEDRRRGGIGVLELPNVQRTVGEMYTALHASRAVVHRALAEMDDRRDPFFDPAATVAKEFVSEQAIKIGLAVMDLQGGEGYMRRHPWERALRDALGLIGGQGAQELLLIQLGQHAALEIRHRRARMEKARGTIPEGGPAAAACEALMGTLARRLDGLDARLHRPGVRVLDVGAGPERIGTELRRWLPAAEVVGVDPTALDDLDEGDFDVAWIAAGPVSPRAVLGALRLGGWALLAAPGEVAASLYEAGFGAVQVVPGCTSVVAGRRTR